ncbi:MAG: cytochrome P450 [Gammaproteobacteria bacterium]
MTITAPNNIDAYKAALRDIDMSDPSLFERNEAAAYFERLRKECPVHFSEGSDCGPFWSITKFDDIISVDKNHKLFSADSSHGGHLLGYEMWFKSDPDLQLPMIIAMDPPRHDTQRKAVSPVVSAENLKKMETGIRDSAIEILDSLPDNEPFNWVERVSIELTTRTLAVLFDFPFGEQNKLTRWSDVAMSIPGDGITESWENRKAEMMEMKACFEDMWAARKTNTGGFDLVSMLATTLDDDAMSPDEYMGNVVLLIVGGNDTTRNSLTGSVLALNQFPDQNRKLRENLELIPNFVSEAIRWQTPVAHMKRTALEDTEIRGQKIRKGDKVVMWYVSGNRDEDVFERPYELIVDRPRARNHLSFGFGLHRCVGNRLGELQLRIAWEEILKRFKTVEVVGDPVRVYSNVTMGYSSLPVKVTRY